MKFVIQRVSEASVRVGGTVIGSISGGFVVLIGIAQDDTEEKADKLIDKMVKLRIFEDEDGKTNLSLRDVGGSILLISQFTLYADTRRGNRPSFIHAGKPDMARPMFDYIVERTRQSGIHVETGEFGADMKVSLVNDGPFTILLESET